MQIHAVGAPLYKTFQECLEKLGFTIDPYGPCVVNKYINGKQCTICWYVDGTKILHVEIKVVDWVINQIEQKIGKITVKGGKEHTFVGVDIIFNDNSIVTLLMEDYVVKCIEK